MKSAYLLTLFVAFLISGCSQPTEKESTEVPLRLVKTVQIGEPGQSFVRELPGVVAANQQADLSFRIAGNLTEILVREGDEVSAGQVLAKLDDTDTQIRLKSDQASYDKALADFNRGQALVGNGTISQSEYNQLESSKASAEAALESTKQNIQYSTLTAPFSGFIAKRIVDNFEEVQAKQTVYVLQDISSIDIKIDVPESIMIITGEHARPNVVAMFDAIPDKTFPLTFKEVATQADPETNTYEVTMSMPRVLGYNILPGMSVTARATPPTELTQFANSVFVPAQAVLEDSEGRFAFVAVPSDSGTALVERRSVVTGVMSSVGLEIVSGLNTGEHLIIAGMSKMYSGLQVRWNKG